MGSETLARAARPQMLRSSAKYTAILWVNVQNSLAYTADVLLRSVWMVVLMVVFIALWATTYKVMGSEEISGYTLPQMLWYLTMTESIIIASGRVARKVDEEVKTGAVGISLLRPYHYIGFQAATYCGELAVPFLVNLLVGAATVWVAVGGPPTAWVHAPAVLVSILLGFTLYFLNQLCIGLLAFWLEDTSGIDLIYGRILWILGGMLLPIELFPGPLQDLVRLLPFQAVLYAPARLFVDFSWDVFWSLFGQQLIWSLVLGALSLGIYRKGVGHIHANGG